MFLIGLACLKINHLQQQYDILYISQGANLLHYITILFIFLSQCVILLQYIAILYIFLCCNMPLCYNVVL